MLRAYMQDSVRPASLRTERPGRWVAEPPGRRPSCGARLHLNPDGLLRQSPAAEAELRVLGLPDRRPGRRLVVRDGETADWPGDQRAEDGM